MSNEYFDKFGYPLFYESIEEYKMARITNEQLYEKLIKLEVVLLGIPDSEDMGLYGEVRDTKKLVKEMNGTVRSDHIWIRAYRYAFYAIFAVGVIVISGNRMGFW